MELLILHANRWCGKKLPYRWVVWFTDPCLRATLLTPWIVAQFVQNVWIESYDPTIEDSYRKQIEVDVSYTWRNVAPMDTDG